MKLLEGVRYILPGTQVAHVHKVKATEVNIATPAKGKTGYNNEGLGFGEWEEERVCRGLSSADVGSP